MTPFIMPDRVNGQSLETLRICSVEIAFRAAKIAR
jgi:hypothetical protein